MPTFRYSHQRLLIQVFGFDELLHQPFTFVIAGRQVLFPKPVYQFATRQAELSRLASNQKEPANAFFKALLFVRSGCIQVGRDHMLLCSIWVTVYLPQGYRFHRFFR
jgi:hypothetical protein